MEIAARTDRGRVRANNEDRIEFDIELGVAVLADGMGGQNAGEVASATATATVMQHLRGNRVDAATALGDAVRLANRAVYRLAHERAEYAGMGTTLVAAMVTGDAAVTVHAGDSRAYLFRDGLMRLTADHSVVQQLVDMGVLTPTQARRSPQRHIVTRALGMVEDVPLALNRTPFREHDVLLLCSDGLTDMVDDGEIAALCARAQEPQAIVDALVAAALRAGGLDNVSVVAMRR